jgi:uncharacterized OB-fold protein
MNPMQQMAAYAANGSFALQRCTVCHTTQYPPRELCAACLSDALQWQVSDVEVGELLGSTVLHHSHEASFRERLPLRVGLVRLDAGPTIVCFLADECRAGIRVRVTASNDAAGRAVLTATAISLSATGTAASFQPITRETS